MKQLADRYSWVEYEGFVPPKEISRLFDWTDVTIVPSAYETLNRVAAESAAAGKIVVSSDIPGPREIVTDGITGYLLPQSVDSFVNKLQELANEKISNMNSMRAMGYKAQEKIATEFNEKQVYSSLARLFLTTPSR
jgi:glycosyltransferase involved in cell wall biosynthesis